MLQFQLKKLHQFIVCGVDEQKLDVWYVFWEDF